MEVHLRITQSGKIISRASVGEMLMTMFLQCLSRGMTLPFTACHMGVNGSVSVTHLSNLNSPMEGLFKTSERIELPVKVMIVDWLGHSLKVTVTQKDGELRTVIR